MPKAFGSHMQMRLYLNVVIFSFKGILEAMWFQKAKS
jgi:hypothetical protein